MMWVQEVFAAIKVHGRSLLLYNKTGVFFN